MKFWVSTIYLKILNIYIDNLKRESSAKVVKWFLEWRPPPVKRDSGTPGARPKQMLTAVFPLTIPEMSIESLDKSANGRWSLEVSTTVLRCFRSKSRPWNLKYEHL